MITTGIAITISLGISLGIWGIICGGMGIQKGTGTGKGIAGMQRRFP